ncbi:hypothetical protein SK37_05383 [Citrobacter sp. MGH109]|nr:hypothetical protein SK37_05383 [Citrobacter sp. MGH109]
MADHDDAPEKIKCLECGKGSVPAEGEMTP